MAFIKKGGKRYEVGGRSAFAGRGKTNFAAKKPWSGKYSDSRASDTPNARYKATCSNCGNSCEVPFKPVNGKPVFCRDCFVKTGDTAHGRAGDRFPRRDFAPRTLPSPRAENNSNSNTEVLKQLEKMNAALERLIRAVEAMPKA